MTPRKAELIGKAVHELILAGMTLEEMSEVLNQSVEVLQPIVEAVKSQMKIIHF